MPQASLDTLRSAIASGTPHPIYLLYGDNDFLKDEVLRAAVPALADEATREFNVDIVRGGDTDAGVLSLALDALPVIAARRVVVIRDAPSLSRDARAVLDRYAANPARSTVLFLVAPRGWKRDAGFAAEAVAVEAGVLSEREVIEWVRKEAGTLGTSIEANAASALTRAAGSDLALAASELRKLRDFAGDSSITVAHVEAAVGAVPGKAAGDLVDLVCARDGRGAAVLAPVVLRQPKASAVGIVLSLTAHMLGIGQVLQERARRTPARQVEGALYSMMGEARSVPVGRPWKEAVATMVRAAPQWDWLGVNRALRILSDADSALKNTGVSTEEQVLATAFLAMCAQTRTAA